jgi:hypothetical protein
VEVAGGEGRCQRKGPPKEACSNESDWRDFTHDMLNDSGSLYQTALQPVEWRSLR